MNKALVVLSGGQDSTTCLYLAKAAGFEVCAVTFDYGQRHSIELEAARTIGKMAGVTHHEFIKLGNHILESTSPLVSNFELEQYADSDSLPKSGIEKTFVPMRNQLFMTIAANRAIARECGYIYTGVCQEDFGGYPDCRDRFIRSLERSTHLSLSDNARSGPILKFRTPLMYMTKAQSVIQAVETPGCYSALAYSHTAYDGQYPPRGKDHATLLRAKGFEDAGICDPLLLRAVFADGVMTSSELPETPTYAKENTDKWMNFLIADLEFNDALPIN